MRLLAVAMLVAALPVAALAQQPPPRQATPQQQRQAQPPAPQPPTPAESRRQFCDHSLGEVDTLVSSLNAAFRGREAAQRDAARLARSGSTDEARQRTDNWRRMIDELSSELQKWTLVRAALGCPAYGQ